MVNQTEINTRGMVRKVREEPGRIETGRDGV
jgi:hypothetical protein